MKTRTMLLTIMSCLFIGVTTGAQTAAQRETTDLLPEGTFTNGIEGPATDKSGNLYAVNYGKEGTIGIVRPDGSHECFVTLPEGSTGNGIRFNKAGEMLVADYTGHNILKVDMKTKGISVYAHEPKMNQPNDIALAPNGNLYASDPDWPNKKGQLWLVTPDGKVTLLEGDMGTTNGIDVSPDGKKLYVNESAQLKVWVYDIKQDGTLKNKTLFHTFEGFGMDGIRCDVKGNLYLCRYEKGTVALINPKGKLIREIQLKGKKPSNITFGGPDNRRCFVTLQDRGCFETFTAEYPGRE
ncbi:SMP-30/gluconolactonase/LRE family protein [Parabacteroides faecis]|uniref:SMP-30/gluconolactonase/LRE family protein n=1 Tax=Parabacteroides TaxID=375288 RepID=UPI000F00434F|nr:MULTISPECIES: SMP-30/gluconolactonase/LRE family protein [Parabacteroides]MBC8618331.1 SMP-30/gluconolactonase/LRE family protein [Parabacteroides faecis]RHS00508.1 SMP-30/gluconolactonase/LRE family protein [Parabacteroides sp. AF14-59]